MIIVTDLGFRWGSCGNSGTLRFNWHLIQLPVRLVDYVLVHELVHLHERNHTSEFWRMLERVLPDWKERKEELSRKRAEMTWYTDGDEVKARGSQYRRHFAYPCKPANQPPQG
jgi:predicted metal-dependent hydrolase